MARKFIELKIGCMAKAHDDEPTFVLLARDKVAPDVVREWCRLRCLHGKNQVKDAQIQEALELANLMEKEQTEWHEASHRSSASAQPAGEEAQPRHSFKCGSRIYEGTTGESSCELPVGHTGRHKQGKFDWYNEGTSEQPAPQEQDVALQHGRCCRAEFDFEADCTCGLQYRIQLRTEQEMHAAWRKRAEEAEAELIVSNKRRDEQWTAAYIAEAESRGDTTANLPAILARLSAAPTARPTLEEQFVTVLRSRIFESRSQHTWKEIAAELAALARKERP